jgi:hypothetical protein
MLTIERMMRLIAHVNMGALIALLAWMIVHHSSLPHSFDFETLTAHISKEQK